MTGMVAFVSLLHAQKVKYKDIFPDLEARKFNKVEPQLKAFLANEKNADHANANYQMGLITEAHFLLQDIVADTAALFTYGDEALRFYEKSITLITEKELKKHDEYYQSFYRRDLRTGEFGIKLSDVHLDIENKIDAIQTRIASVRAFHAAVTDLTKLEGELLAGFNSLVGEADSYNDYLMKADLDAISKLGDLQAAFKAFDDKANETLKVGEALQVDNYYATIEYQPIKRFLELAPVFPESNDKIATWQFSDWASKAKAALNGEVFVMKNELKEFDRQLRGATNAIKSGASATFPRQIKKTLETVLAKYDPLGLPRQILQARILENSIRLMSDTLLNPVLLDSSVIAVQLEMADSAIQAIESLKTATAFDNAEVDIANSYYEEYITSLGGSSEVLKYARETRTWLAGQDTTWRNRLAFWDMRNNWGTSETDTIPLHVVDTSYHGLFVTKGFLDLPDNEIISWGVKRDSIVGFIAKFGADRSLIWQNRFESELFADAIDHDFQTDTLASDVGQIALYLFDENPVQPSNLTVVNATLDGILNWSVSTETSRKPEYTTYSHAIQETTIFLYPQEDYPLTNGELGYFIINRDGEIR